MSFAPAALAVLIASVTMLPAPRPEPARPARNRIPATTGAALGVLIVVANGDRQRRNTCLPAILVCPNDAPCLACPYTGRAGDDPPDPAVLLKWLATVRVANTRRRYQQVHDLRSA